MQRSHPKTTFTVSITPFEADGSLSTTGLREHLRRLAAGDLGVYVVGSGSSEAYTLSEQEIDTVLEIAVDELKGVVPVRAMGWEPHTAKEMVDFSRKAESFGVDAIQVYNIDMGHGMTPSVVELETYYRTVIESVSTPLVVATHDAVPYKIPLDLLHRLVADYPHIIGINCTHNDIDYLVTLANELDPRLELHIGGSQQAYACMAVGGTGYMSGEGNLAPQLARSLTKLFDEGDMAGATSAFAKVLELYSAGNGTWGSIRGVKAALAELGLPGGPTRPPLLPLREDERPALDRLLRLVQGVPLDAL